MDAEQAARSTSPVALRNGLNRNQNESGKNSTSERPCGQAEQEAPSSTAKSRTITLCGAFNLPEADADEDDDPDWW